MAEVVRFVTPDASIKDIDTAVFRLFETTLEVIKLKKYEDAKKFLNEIIKFKPDFSDAYFQLGNVFAAQNKAEEAFKNFKKAIDLEPTFFEAYNNLGTLFYDLKRTEEAVSYYEKAIELRPQAHFTLRSCAGCLALIGQQQKAVMYYKKALEIAPQDPEIYNDLLLTQIYTDFISPEELTATAKKFGENVANPLIQDLPFSGDRDPDRKLRIGYVSPDFRDHPVRYFFKPLLNHHDRSQFEIFAYSNTPQEDSVTQEIKEKVDHWRDIKSMDDEKAARLIRNDAIDILIDLAGHTGKNRLLVFARKPAPVQATWLGFPATTGMKAMDYRIVDFHTEPPGLTEHLSVERLWRLPTIFCCYEPHKNSAAPIDHPPFEDNGFVTFGCFNNFEKVSNAALSAWAEILKKVPGSRLLLEITGIEKPGFLETVTDRMQHAGLPLERVTMEPRRKSNQFSLYNKIDIALDPFPCVGGTTSMDTLWMGVPFVTLAGKSFVQRMGVTILANAGLPDLIANTIDDYVKKATELAGDRPRLKIMRDRLRDKTAASPVMDQARFVRAMEEAYRAMWKDYCVA